MNWECLIGWERELRCSSVRLEASRLFLRVMGDSGIFGGDLDKTRQRASVGCKLWVPRHDLDQPLILQWASNTSSIEQL